MTDPSPVLLFDGDCRFCNAWVAFVLRHEAAPRLRFAALPSAAGQDILRVREIDPASCDTMDLVEGARIASHSTALWRLARYLRGAPRWLVLLRWIPVPLRDAAYRLFGHWRYRLFGSDRYCSVLTPELHQRFLVHEVRDD